MTSMFLHSNIKFLRNYTHTTQEAFGKLFGKTRSNIDSYERGNARPNEEFQTAVCEHFDITLDVLLNKDLQKNPGLMFANISIPEQKQHGFEDLLKAKEETIRDLRSQVKYLQELNDRLLKKSKVA